MLFKVESAAPVSLLEMHILGPHPDFSNQNLYGWGPGICYNKPSRPCWCAWSLKCPGVLSGSNNTFLSVEWGLWGLNVVMWLIYVKQHSTYYRWGFNQSSGSSVQWPGQMGTVGMQGKGMGTVWREMTPGRSRSLSCPGAHESTVL